MNVEISGIKEAIKHVKKIQAELDGKKGTLYQGRGSISDITATSINNNFNAEGRPPWQARKYNYSHPILDKTGLTRDTAERTARNNWMHATKEHVLSVITTFYGVIHQKFGIKTDGQKIKRIFVRLLPEENEKIRIRIKKVFK